MFLTPVRRFTSSHCGFLHCRPPIELTPATEPELAGYKVYRSTVPGSFQTAIANIPAGTTTFTVNGLQSGTTYYFVVTAYNTSFSESVHSNEVSKTF